MIPCWADLHSCFHPRGHRLTHTLGRFCPGSDASCWVVTGRQPGWRLEVAHSGCSSLGAFQRGSDTHWLSYCCITRHEAEACVCVCVCVCICVCGMRGGGQQGVVVLRSPAPSPLHAFTHALTNGVHLWQLPTPHHTHLQRQAAPTSFRSERKYVLWILD